MNDKIKPCPWCECSESSLVEVSRVSPVSVSMSYSRECDRCGAHGPRAANPVEADEAWNHRPTAWRSCETDPPPIGKDVLVRYSRGTNIPFMWYHYKLAGKHVGYEWCEVPE